jgi:hypothetical protein
MERGWNYELFVNPQSSDSLPHSYISPKAAALHNTQSLARRLSIRDIGPRDARDYALKQKKATSQGVGI